MKVFTASRLSEGNKVFPARIVIDDDQVTLKVPGFFSGKEKSVPYTRISSVDIECPFVGYSDIIIETTGEGSISAHGFTKGDVKEMKDLILSKI